jgi:hypothetical protein
VLAVVSAPRWARDSVFLPQAAPAPPIGCYSPPASAGDKAASDSIVFYFLSDDVSYRKYSTPFSKMQTFCHQNVKIFFVAFSFSPCY